MEEYRELLSSKINNVPRSYTEERRQQIIDKMIQEEADYWHTRYNNMLIKILES